MRERERPPPKAFREIEASLTGSEIRRGYVYGTL